MSTGSKGTVERRKPVDLPAVGPELGKRRGVFAQAGQAEDPVPADTPRSPSRWFASELTIEIGVSISPHRAGPSTHPEGFDHVRRGAGCRPCRSALQAVADPAGQIRDLAAAGPPGDDDRRGGRSISGGPVDHHADPYG